MPGDETLQKLEEDSDSEEEKDVEEVEAVPKVEIDVTKLTPLSPEVISKQVGAIVALRTKRSLLYLGYDKSRY